MFQLGSSPRSRRETSAKARPLPVPEISPFLPKRMRNGNVRNAQSAQNPVGGVNGAGGTVRKRRSESTLSHTFCACVTLSTKKLTTRAVLAAFWEVEILLAAGAGCREPRGLSGILPRRAVDKALRPC